MNSEELLQRITQEYQITKRRLLRAAAIHDHVPTEQTLIELSEIRGKIHGYAQCIELIEAYQHSAELPLGDPA